MKTIQKTSIILLALFITTCSLCAISVKAQQATNGGIKTLQSSGYAPVNGLKLYYEIHGEGQPVVLLHGSYMTIDLNWSQVIPELAKTHKVIALEMQGHGHTADIDRAVSFKALADDVAGLLKYLKIDSADVIGYSLGGTVAYEFAILHPAMVKKMVLISTTFRYKGWQQEVLDAFSTFKPEFFDQTPLKTAYEKVAPDPGHWRAFLTKFIAFDKEDFDLGADKIKGIMSPLLLIMGDNDGIAPEHKVEMYRLAGGGTFGDMAGLPASQLAILPGTTHVSLMMETGKLLSFITPFLGK